MKHHIAIDGRKSGWLALYLSNDGRDLQHELIEPEQLHSFINANKDSRLILIDMPISLLEEGNSMRCCDRLARQFLGPGKADPGESEPGVRTGSIHRIKGLEFRAVALACSDPDDPMNRLESATQLEKAERYVAISRAREEVLVTVV